MVLPRLLFIFWLSFLGVNAVLNITVDDDDGSITYNPPSSWNETDFDSLNVGGRHMVTSDSSATATFTFKGIAIYFYSPLWPFRVSTALSLDGEPAQLLDLQDYGSPVVDDGPETVRSKVVWSLLGLDNTDHTLVISVGEGEDIAIVDALVYTALDASDSTSSTSTASLSTSFLPSPTQSSVSAKSSSSSKKGLSIALGLVCAIFGVLVLWALFWYWRRRRREEEESYLERDNAPEMSNTLGGAYASRGPRTGYYSRPRNPNSRSRPSNNTAGRRVASSSRPISSSPLRHSVISPPTRKKPLTTIPEISAREDGGVDGGGGGGGGVPNSKSGNEIRPSSTAGPYHPDGADRGDISPRTSFATPPWTEFDAGR